MALIKTEKGRAALHNRDAALGARERQMLVMSDGKRTPADFQGLFGSDAKAVLDRLVSLGFIMDASEATLSRGSMTETGTFSISTLSAVMDASVSSRAPLSAQVAPTQASLAAPVLSSRTRRSVAAAKMYMTDLLQLVRDMDSASFSVAIQTSHDEKDLVMNLMNALRFIHHKSGASYGQRVLERLQVTLPEMYLPDLDHIAQELYSNAPSA